MKQSRLKQLQQMPIFGGVTEDTLLFLLNLAPTVRVASGDFFFQEHQRGGTMYVLEKGKVAVIKPFEAMGHPLAFLNTGDCFGEMEMIDPCPRAASVLAITDSAAIQISAASLLSLYRADMEQFTLVQMNMSREMSRRLRRLNKELFATKLNPPTERPFFLSHAEIIEKGLVATGPKRKEQCNENEDIN